MDWSGLIFGMLRRGSPLVPFDRQRPFSRTDLAGTSNEVADALAAEAASGVEGFVIQLTDFGQPETVAQFMEEVAPAVRSA